MQHHVIGTLVHLKHCAQADNSHLVFGVVSCVFMCKRKDVCTT